MSTKADKVKKKNPLRLNILAEILFLMGTIPAILMPLLGICAAIVQVRYN